MTCGLILLIKWVVPEFICNLTGSTSEEGTGKQSQQKTAYEMRYGLVGSEMCIRDRDIPARARTAHNGLLQKRLEEDLC